MGVDVLGESKAGMDTLADAVAVVSKDNDPNSDVLDSAHDSEEGESGGDTSGVDTAGDTAGVDVCVDDVVDEMAGENCVGKGVFVFEGKEQEVPGNMGVAEECTLS